MNFIIKDIQMIIFKYKHQLEMKDVLDEMNKKYFQQYDPPFTYLSLTVFRPYNLRYSGARQIRKDYNYYIQQYFTTVGSNYSDDEYYDDEEYYDY